MNTPTRNGQFTETLAVPTLLETTGERLERQDTQHIGSTDGAHPKVLVAQRSNVAVERKKARRNARRENRREL